MTAVTVNGIRLNPYTMKRVSGYTGGYVPQLGSGAVLHVKESGNDSNDGSLLFPLRTINRAMNLVTVGGTIMLHATNGQVTTYAEHAMPALDARPSTDAAVYPIISGTRGNLCTLMAAPGDEGKVQISGSGIYIGIHTNKQDYWCIWGIRVVDCNILGIASYGTSSTSGPAGVQTTTGVTSVGWIVENCLVKDITINFAVNGEDNSSSIGPWGSIDWTVRNCKIIGPVDISVSNKLASCMQIYQCGNLKLQNCYLKGTYGIYIKDHWLLDGTTRTKYERETEISYCVFDTIQAPLRVGIRANNYPESGGHYIHHNVCYGNYAAGADRAFVSADMDGAFSNAGQSLVMRIEQNTMDSDGYASMKGFYLSGWSSIISKGNVINAPLALYSMMRGGAAHVVKNNLTFSDENVFITPSFKIEINKDEPEEGSITSLASWKTKVAGAYPSLQMSNPDAHSVVVATRTGLFVDASARNYRPANGSLLLNFMQNGHNAGAYELGTETIGLLPVYSAGD